MKIKPITKFTKCKLHVDGHRGMCVSCRTLAAKLRDRTYDGRIRCLLRSHKGVAKRNGQVPPDYNLTQFHDWCEEEGYTELWNAWYDTRYIRKTMPAVVRLNVEDSYTLDNLRLTTYGEYTDSKTIPVTQMKDGVVVKEYGSIKEAAKESGLTPKQVSYVVAGRGKTAGGYSWVATGK